MSIDPTFNGWAFSTAGFIADTIEVRTPHPVRSAKASYGDRAVTSEGHMAGRIVRIAGTISETDTDTAIEDWGELIKNLRGSGAEVKKGQLDPYAGGRHLYAQLVNNADMTILRPPGKIRVALEFYADDPFFRVSPIKTILDTPASTVDITFSSDFNGDAPRMPLVLNCGGGWQKDEILRCYNSTTGIRFEYIVSQDLTSSQDLVIDGEAGEILEANEVVMEQVSGALPWVQGSTTNTFDFTGTDRLQEYSFVFWDRFYS